MPFRYQLQKVQDLKDKEKKAIDAEVMEKSARRNQEQDKLDELEIRRAAAQKGLASQMAAGATGDVAASNDYIQLLGMRIEAQRKVLAQAEAVLAEATGRQTEVQKFLKKLEKHRDMKFADWQAVQKKKEAQRIDEMAGTIFMKKRLAAEETALEELDRMEKLEKLRLLKAMREKRERHY